MAGSTILKLVPRPFFGYQQKVVVAIDVAKRTVTGFVELSFLPNQDLRGDLGGKKIALNAHQLAITQVLLNDAPAIFELKNYLDTPVEDKLAPTDGKSFKTFTKAASNFADAGELLVEVPLGFQLKDGQITVRVDYTARDSAGLHFVLPTGDNLHRIPHMFNVTSFPGVRSWIPCVDQLQARCFWEMFYTVSDPNMTVVSSGDLIKITPASNGGRTFQFFERSRVMASSIMLAVGPFETVETTFTYKEENQAAEGGNANGTGVLRSSASLLNLGAPTAGSSLSNQPGATQSTKVTYYCLPGRLADLQNTTRFLANAQLFLSHFLNGPFPFKTYKQVFVEDAYSKVNFGAEVVVLSSSLLHSEEVIDQTFISRRLQVIALASQWFGCFATAAEYADYWLVFGMIGYLALIFCSKMFGNNEVKRQVKKMIDYVCYHPNNQPLYATNYTSPQELFSPLFFKKSTLVFYLMEKKMGTQAVKKVLNTLLLLDNDEPGLINLPMLSTNAVLRRIKKVTGTDMLHFFNEWVFSTSCPHLSAGFWYDTTNNDIEVAVKLSWNTPPTAVDHVTTVLMREVELDPNAPPAPNNISKKLYNPTLAFYEHQLMIEGNILLKTFQCKSRYGLSKTATQSAEAGDEEKNKPAIPTNSPVLWLRFDPGLNLIASVNLRQPEHLWRAQLLYDRDVVSQMDALQNLSAFALPTVQTMTAVLQIITDREQFYRVRMRAAYCYAQLIARAKDWESMVGLINYFKKEYFDMTPLDKTKQGELVTVRANDFSDFPSYFMQKAIPYALSLIENANLKSTPTDVVKFVNHLLRANDNSNNDYIDNYYLAALLRAAGNFKPADPLPPHDLEEAKHGDSDRVSTPQGKVLAQFYHYLNVEKVLPSYHNTVAVAVLEALAKWQGRQIIVLPMSFFLDYATRSNFRAVRLAAIRAAIFIGMDAPLSRSEKSAVETFTAILNLIASEPLSGAWFRYTVVKTLLSDPNTLLEAGSDSSWDIENVAQCISMPADVPAALNSLIAKRLQFRFRGLKTSQSPEVAKLRTSVWEMLNSNFSGSDARLRLVIADLFDQIGGHETARSTLPERAVLPTKPDEVIRIEKEIEKFGGSVKKRPERSYSNLPTPKRQRVEEQPAAPLPPPSMKVKVKMPDQQMVQPEEVDAMDVDIIEQLRLPQRPAQSPAPITPSPVPVAAPPLPRITVKPPAPPQQHVPSHQQPVQAPVVLPPPMREPPHIPPRKRERSEEEPSRSPSVERTERIEKTRPTRTSAINATRNVKDLLDVDDELDNILLESAQPAAKKIKKELHPAPQKMPPASPAPRNVAAPHLPPALPPVPIPTAAPIVQVTAENFIIRFYRGPLLEPDPLFPKLVKITAYCADVPLPPPPIKINFGA